MEISTEITLWRQEVWTNLQMKSEIVGAVRESEGRSGTLPGFAVFGGEKDNMNQASGNLLGMAYVASGRAPQPRRNFTTSPLWN